MGTSNTTVQGTDSDLVVRPEDSELEELRVLREFLASVGLEAVTFADGSTKRLPVSAKRALNLALEYLARGLAVAIEPYSQLLTTQRAADLLKVSRPTVVELLRRRAIPYSETEGGHRRVLLSDLLDYQQRLRDRGDTDEIDRDDASVDVEGTPFLIHGRGRHLSEKHQTVGGSSSTS